ncbi:DUF3011 domain-containing protein [Xanthomonas melonis]|uniref:DUF3011 domain-containing protein n=1 Tax=Xanthomonas melonis TaxID=56456 RepID=A0A2S7DDD8_9XANT|nr:MULTISPECIES: DUF3011 domain-containing protein [Xanthomonas]MCC4588134.1 DUF3011 domain-containing protein [Xanthomonas sp. NCPPB 1067]MCC4601245.1 DUF3011 domain-containing protein [Xanthomonas melonis]MCD0245324.1 DUF3011 domain-containing protein [Xanthomonas melonis]MCD0257735.1 DUF3011 domain-containing protein [Xanthomonas melonis]MCD0265912.1 DUF3011 domain-containing protein [Xanthomonas melonis]
MKWLIGFCGVWCLPLLIFADARAAERGSDVVRCESRDMARVHCAMETVHGVQLVRQLSETSCIRGSEWGVERDGVWVEQGCRAEFATAAPAATVMRRVVRCDSNGGKVVCPVVLRGAPVRLLRQRSIWPCKENRTWGTRRNEIWVSRGCDGEFEVGAEDGSGFVAMPRLVTCESKKSARRTCGVSVERSVRLGRQMSRNPCVEGQSWGWSRDGVWVNDGCRAEFIVD